jgi:hypothetical protein
MYTNYDKKLRIKNFKGSQDSGTIPFSKLTGFFGPNIEDNVKFFL